MAASLSVAFFLEDIGQEAIIPPLFKRVAVEEGLGSDQLECQVLHSRGGGSLAAYAKFLKDAKKSRLASANLLIVGSDGNCKGFATRREQILKKAIGSPFTEVIAAVPDPHVERWYLLDIAALANAAGVHIALPPVPEKCEKDLYKNILRHAFDNTEVTPPLGGIEYGERVAEGMNLYSAAKQDHGLADFLDRARAWLKQQHVILAGDPEGST
ncbi:MAG TPA: hypothetical protein VEM96_03690 [Pyrinomonadaceae bacterium]|nr:hypothetical protein [Pyrinomonadaceae bacterium]